MTANTTLAKIRSIDSKSVEKINTVHEKIDELMKSACLGFNDEVYKEIENLEYALQTLWKFDVDAAYHTHKHLYKFRTQWVGRKFKCLDTGEVFEIPEDVRERDLYTFGNKCFVDVGRLGAYSRFGGKIMELESTEKGE